MSGPGSPESRHPQDDDGDVDDDVDDDDDSDDDGDGEDPFRIVMLLILTSSLLSQVRGFTCKFFFCQFPFPSQHWFRNFQNNTGLES